MGNKSKRQHQFCRPKENRLNRLNKNVAWSDASRFEQDGEAFIWLYHHESRNTICLVWRVLVGVSGGVMVGVFFWHSLKSITQVKRYSLSDCCWWPLLHSFMNNLLIYLNSLIIKRHHIKPMHERRRNQAYLQGCHKLQFSTRVTAYQHDHQLYIKLLSGSLVLTQLCYCCLFLRFCVP